MKDFDVHQASRFSTPKPSRADRDTTYRQFLKRGVYRPAALTDAAGVTLVPNACR